jgi:hypothetical protein
MFRFLRKSGPRRDRIRFDPEKALFWLSEHDPFTAGNALEGIAILGGTGAGKTTTSGYRIARAMIALGWGGLVCTVKTDEADRWKKLCQLAGRSQDLILFDATGGQCFNFLDWEVNRGGEGAGLTENVVQLIEQLGEMLDRMNGQGGGRDDEPFWKHAMRELTRNSVDLLKFAAGTLSVPFLLELLRDAPASPEEARSASWRERSSIWLAIERGREKELAPHDRHDFETAAHYFTHIWPALADKTRSIVLAKLTGLVDVMGRGLLRRLFSGTTTVTPDDAVAGKIVVINLPTKEFFSVGVLAQTIWKLQYQRAVERRRPDAGMQPCFLYLDEAQNLLSARDMQFAATARSSRCANIWLTQNISNLYVALGADESGKAAADSLMGLAQTKIFHSNSDPVTNTWAADLIGRRKQRFFSSNVSQGQMRLFTERYEAPNNSYGSHESFEYIVHPHHFSMLEKPSPPRRRAAAIVYQGGRIWRATRDTYLLTEFAQGF